MLLLLLGLVLLLELLVLHRLLCQLCLLRLCLCMCVYGLRLSGLHLLQGRGIERRCARRVGESSGGKAVLWHAIHGLRWSLYLQTLSVSQAGATRKDGTGALCYCLRALTRLP